MKKYIFLVFFFVSFSLLYPQTIDEAYKTVIKKYNNDKFILEDGFEVEKTDYGYVGYIGYRIECILFKSGMDWKIWVEGKETYNCKILKFPRNPKKIDYEEVVIEKIVCKDDFSCLVYLLNGFIYRAGPPALMVLWLPLTKALIYNENDIIYMINLDFGGEPVFVFPIH